jgi:hypothetical protein
MSIKDDSESKVCQYRIDNIFKHLECSICKNDLKRTIITKTCCHRFCEDCILDAINKLNKCPVCNTDLKLYDIMRDYQFDNLRDSLLQLKEKSTDGFLNIIENTKPSSEVAKRCFKYTFTAEKSNKVDYFVCTTCDSTKWICSPCSLKCHKGHNLKQFSMNHKADWPCCYCLKTPCCQLVEVDVQKITY